MPFIQFNVQKTFWKLFKDFFQMGQHEYFKKPKSSRGFIFQFFSKNVDPNLFIYLVN